MTRLLAAFTLLSTATGLGWPDSSVAAASISGTGVSNTSNAAEVVPPTTFQTESTLGAVATVAPGVESFVHRMAFVNTLAAGGGVAQVHKRNVQYQIDFTVEDPLGQGFEVDLESLVRGASRINQTSDGGLAFANGASFFVTYDDSTDAPNTFSNLIPLFNGVPGVSVNGIETATAEMQSTEAIVLGLYTGTTDFSVRFTTRLGPTTNLLFGNGQTGDGEIDFGLGSLAAGLSSDPADYGHFLTVQVTSEIPEPTGAILALAGLLVAARSGTRPHTG